MSITDLAARFWIGAVKSLAHVPLGARKVLARVVADGLTRYSKSAPLIRI